MDMERQPIETAPDGEFLGWCSTFGFGVVVILDGEMSWKFDDGGMYYCECSPDVLYTLPQPPK